MRILHVEDRIVLRLLRHFLEIEIERRIVLAEQHHEAHRVAADLLDHLAQRDELARPLRHAHRLAGAEELHQLAEQDVELASPSVTAVTAAFMRLT